MHLIEHVRAGRQAVESAAPHPSGRPRRSERGLTLVGLMVGLAVGTLVLSGALGVYLMIVSGARDNAQLARLNQELRAALEVMEQDIRRAGFWDFADSDGGGDADGNGLLEWRDLGLDAEGAGIFDTDADGDTDVQDLNPINNPFQRAYGRINNDLCIGTDSETGACAASACSERNADGDCLAHVQRGSCLTFSYDLDLDGRIGIRACDADEDEADCPRPSAPPFDASAREPYAWRAWYPPDQGKKTRDIEMEMLGFRLRGTAIAMRVGRSGRDDPSFGCGSGRWEAITSADVRISELELRLVTHRRNANPAKSGTARCASGDVCREIRSVEIRLTGSLADDTAIEQRLGTQVAIRNDRYVAIP